MPRKPAVSHPVEDWQREVPLLLKKVEAARKLNVSPRHVDDLVEQKLLEKVKLGRTARITTASVLALAGQRSKVLA
jgi:excisionase family DNA binding protein